MNRYPVRYEPDPGGGFTATFRDIPEAISQGDTLEEVREAALDALVTAMDFYFEDSRKVPAASAAQAGEEVVELPASVSAKVLLLNTMIDERMRPSDLAKSMNVVPQEVTRILDIHHTTKIDTLAKAFKALGRSLDFVVRPA
jgi:antitoxin HicB